MMANVSLSPAAMLGNGCKGLELREREDGGASVLWTMMVQIETERERRKYILLRVYVSLLSQRVEPTVHQL